MARRNNTILNRFHFNGPVHAAKKEKGVTRVLTLGSSSTAQGYGRNLEKMLGQLKARRFEVINAGIAGTVLFRQIEFFKYYLIYYRPDWLILSMGRNDTRFLYNLHDSKIRQANHLAGFSRLRSLQAQLRRSALYSSIVSSVNEQKAGFNLEQNEGDIYRSISLFRDQLEELVRFCRANGVRIMLVPEPEEVLITYNPGWVKKHRYTRMARSMAWVAKAYQIPFVDVLNVFFQHRLDFLFIDDVHYTPWGQELLAKTVYETLRKEGP